MTSPSEKHMSAADDLVALINGESKRDEQLKIAAAALFNVEREGFREGMKRAAEIARTSGHWEAASVGSSPWPAMGVVWRGLDANQIADKILSESERA